MNAIETFEFEAAHARAASTNILLECEHADRAAEVNMLDGTRRLVCCDCWNSHVDKRREAEQHELNAARWRGVEYWRGRGLDVGAIVYTSGFTIFGVAYAIEGIAKVGRAGAYVSCPKKYGRKQMDPRFWRDVP